MKLLLVTFAICLIAGATLVAGCGSGGGGTGTSGFTAGDNLPVGGGDTPTDGGDTPGDGTNIPHNPEPITLALFGGGLAAFALLRRKKK